MSAAFPGNARKTGYLTGAFRLFYLKGQPEGIIVPHYHSFHKLLFLTGGNLSYGIEGNRYTLLKDDIIFVKAGEVHAPVFDAPAPYERLIAYISPAFPGNGPLRLPEYPDLFSCFDRGEGERQSLIRLPSKAARPVLTVRDRCIAALKAEDPFSSLEQSACLTELLILLNRHITENRCESSHSTALRIDPLIRKAVAFIMQHLDDEELSVDLIAQGCFVSRSYLMHTFKKQLGYTIGDYIADKRLFLADELLSQGLSVTETCYRSGFRNYSAFYYAYKKKYGVSPSAGEASAQKVQEE